MTRQTHLKSLHRLDDNASPVGSVGRRAQVGKRFLRAAHLLLLNKTRQRRNLSKTKHFNAKREHRTQRLLYRSI